jgi:hypothetical protein
MGLSLNVLCVVNLSDGRLLVFRSANTSTTLLVGDSYITWSMITGAITFRGEAGPAAEAPASDETGPGVFGTVSEPTLLTTTKC